MPRRNGVIRSRWIRNDRKGSIVDGRHDVLPVVTHFGEERLQKVVTFILTVPLANGGVNVLMSWVSSQERKCTYPCFVTDSDYPLAGRSIRRAELSYSLDREILTTSWYVSLCHSVLSLRHICL